MREHFGIGFGAKVRIAAANQLIFERLIIFNYAVVDQCQLAAGVEVWMRVLVGDFAVRGPACVTDAERTGDRFLPHELC
jgi:hypothetical protein